MRRQARLWAAVFICLLAFGIVWSPAVTATATAPPTKTVTAAPARPLTAIKPAAPRQTTALAAPIDTGQWGPLLEQQSGD